MRLRLLVLAGLALATSAAAQPVQFSAVVRGELGYGTNPFLQSGVTGGSAFASITVSPQLSYETARSSTVLNGGYTRNEYFHRFGYTDSASVNLSRIDKLSEYLTSTATASYSTSNRAFTSDPQLLVTNDPLNIGRRTRVADGSYQLQWQPSAADRFTIGGDIERLSYGGRHGAIPSTIFSSYTQYAVNAGYDRSIDARTSVGLQGRISEVHSHYYPDSRIYQPSITAKRQLSAIWTIDAHVGVIFEKTLGVNGESNTSLSFGANLCGTYPRTRVCISGERTRAPSGYGSLRADTSVLVTVSHDLTEHSRVNFNADYYRTSDDRIVNVPVIGSSRFWLVSGDYDHDISRRLSAGFGGNYQWRSTRGFGSAHSISATVHLAAKLGRL